MKYILLMKEMVILFPLQDQLKKINEYLLLEYMLRFLFYIGSPGKVTFRQMLRRMLFVKNTRSRARSLYPGSSCQL